MNVRSMGYAGEILHVDLSALKAEKIPTDSYVQWGGGNGLGTKLFWDFCKDKTIKDGRDEKNVVVVATSPLCGTATPSAGGRCEIVGVGFGHYPISWFTRSNIGGRFSSMMKYSGFDALVISGKAPRPVWIEVTNGHIMHPLVKTTKQDFLILPTYDTFCNLFSPPIIPYLPTITEVDGKEVGFVLVFDACCKHLYNSQSMTLNEQSVFSLLGNNATKPIEFRSTKLTDETLDGSLIFICQLTAL